MSVACNEFCLWAISGDSADYNFSIGHANRPSVMRFMYFSAILFRLKIKLTTDQVGVFISPPEHPLSSLSPSWFFSVPPGQCWYSIFI
jgi:hypothetical protein